ncbi:MAG: ATP synthase F1 subunit gamma, partial [Bacteroidales bacterium]|nr:ATP synthase F1 subunit gamma [Bacteroidales bacterium]
MPNLKEVRTRIDSIHSTQQITSAMKMVAASKLRKAQNSILTLRPYAYKLTEILQNLSTCLDNTDESAYSSERDPNNVLLVVISSNKGLCGAFNTNIIKKTNSLINAKYQSQFKEGKLSLFCFGKKASEYFTKRNYQVVESNIKIFDDLNFENTSVFAEKLMKDFVTKKYDKIEIIYNQFKNAAVQRLIVEQFLPIVPPSKDKSQTEEAEISADFIFEPNKTDIVRDIIPKSLKIQLYKTLLDSFASEHGARMTAMHQATDNAQEILKDLRLKYNKARQSAITNELIEIVSGAEALNA